MTQRILLHHVRNHAEYRGGLVEIGLTSDLAVFDSKVADVSLAWLNLGTEHLEDARGALAANRNWSIYSRSYYAVYNASKAVRYRVKGGVSLHGDDHRKAGDLPDDFPNVAHWTAVIAEMYAHRLRADYDNWTKTQGEQTISPNDCIVHAQRFLADCADYLRSKFGMVI